MKTNALILVVVAAIGILFATLAPANMKDKLVGVVTFASDERRCFNFHKADFIDPDSAYVRDSFIWTKKNELSIGSKYPDPAYQKYEAMINVEVLAKNRMGGYVKEYVTCPLVNGSFNSDEAFMYKSERDTPAAVEQAAPAIEEAAPVTE